MSILDEDMAKARAFEEMQKLRDSLCSSRKLLKYDNRKLIEEDNSSENKESKYKEKISE